MKLSKQQLDFIVIGAAKSGTTALYEYLKGHPEIYLPPGKELPYYTEPELYKNGLEDYLAEHFQHADPARLWGKVTPQYMHGINDTMPETIAWRIHKDNPAIKLIAVLRHPIERAYSHYKMSVRRGYEDRSFDDAARELLTPRTLEQARTCQSPTNVYVPASEYGRIIKSYIDIFGYDRVLMIFTEELEQDTYYSIRRICQFLQTDDSYCPRNAGTKYHQGGSRPRLELLTPKYLYKIPLLPMLWKRLAPNTARRRINFWINRWNIRPDGESLDKRSTAYTMLAQHFAEDVQLLEELTGRVVPWTDLRPGRS